MQKTLLVFLFAILNAKDDITEIKLNEESQSISKDITFVRNKGQKVKVVMDPVNLIDRLGKKLAVLIEGPMDFTRMTLYGVGETGDMGQQKLMSMTTDFGKLLFVCDKDFSEGTEWDEIKKQGVFFLRLHSNANGGTFKVTVLLFDKLDLSFGEIYATMVTEKVDSLNLNLKYNGEQQKDLNKLRMQVSTLEKQIDGIITGTASYKGSYILNNIFDNILGGILDETVVSICKESDCNIKLNLKINKVSKFYVESFFISKIETLSVLHPTEYYDRVYRNDSLVYYKLPYIEDMKELDISISLIPVTGEAELYVNPYTKPLETEKYLYQAKGKLSKRVTVSWEEMVQMRTQGYDLFIAVLMRNQGEFLIKVDAHEGHYRGRLSPGYAEAGFVKANDMAKYIVNFKVWEKQQVKFTLKMSVFSGQADIHVKQCKKETFCDFKKEELTDGALEKNSNNEFEKTLTSSCRTNDCNFLIIILGIENHGTHFEVMVQEEQFHYLMLPGHGITVQLNADETKYLKFSHPYSGSDQLYLQAHQVWGSMNLYLDFTEQYPSEEKSKYQQKFLAEHTGLNKSHLDLNMSDIYSDHSGAIYLAVKAVTSAKIDLKFHSKSTETVSLHTLIAGKLESGVIENNKEIKYYQINLSLEENKAQSVSIDLIPLKGKFKLIASRGGHLPTIEQNDLESTDNHLELVYQSYDIQHEYVIGVIPLSKNESQIDFRFKIGVSYSEKTSKLQPGVIINHTLNERNFYQIQMLREMESIMLVKGIFDGYNIMLCGVFSRNSNADFKECEVESSDSQMGFYLPKAVILSFCDKFWKQTEECYLNFEVKGVNDQLFSVGYTYNDQPFQLATNQVITGPSILSQDKVINFIYHPNKEDTNLYFNAKGRKTKILAKLIDGNKIDGALPFPTQADYDTENTLNQSFISLIVYSQHDIQEKGSNPEILISIVPEPREMGAVDKPFDLINGFILQVYTSAVELIRTHIHHQFLYESEQTNFYFYNNGNSGQFSVYANSNAACYISLSIAKGKGMTPGQDSRILKQIKGVNQSILTLHSGDFEGDLKGYYTIQVSTKKNCYLNIYWNNKPDFNFIELNTNYPQAIHIQPNKPLYFSFFVSEKSLLSRKKNGDITLHFKSDSDSTVYLKKIQNKDLVIPDVDNKNFSGFLGPKGGIGYITITPGDENYCTECSFVGSVTSSLEGQLTLLMTLDHVDAPLNLVNGFTFPDTLLSHKGRTYRFVHLIPGPFFINISMLSGVCNVFVDTKPEVNANNAKEYFFLTQNNQTHSYLKIDPTKYNNSQSEFYIRIENPKLDPVTFTVAIFQNEMNSPIELGVSKFIEVGAKDTMNLFFEQKQDDKEYEIRFIIKQVQPDDNGDNLTNLLNNMNRIFKVGLLTYENFQELQQKTIYIDQNKLYVEFESSQSELTKFALHIENIFDFSFQIQIDVTSGKYKLLNLNDSTVDFLEGKQRQTFETYGMKGRFWFFELKMCYGETEVQFYRDLKALQNQTSPIERKTVSENNTFVYYFTMEDSHVYADIFNKNSEKSVFKITAYNEQDLNDNPYQEVAALQDGQVLVDTSNNKISFAPLSIKNFNDDSYDHKVIYTLYISPQFKEMRFAKNCGKHLIEKAFTNDGVLMKYKEFTYSGSKEFNSAGNIQMDLPELSKEKRYYGVVIAQIHLLTRGEGMVEPLRQSMTYYDEFIIIGGKNTVAINFWLPLVGIVGLLFIVWLFINNYIFGDIKRFKDITADMRNITESNIDVFDILESEYKFEEKPKPKPKPVKDNKIEKREIEMSSKDDRTAPLDIDDQ